MFNFDAFKSEYKKNLKKNFAFLKNQKGGITGFVLFMVICIMVLVAFAYHLMTKKLISGEFFFGSIVVFLGWLFVLQVNIIRMKQNREDDSIARNNEIIKRLKIETFKEVNKTIENTAKVLAKMESCYFHICKQAEETTLSAVDSPSSLLNRLEEIYNEINQASICLPELWQKINLDFKAHEIILGEFSKLLSDLDVQFHESILLTNELENYFSIDSPFLKNKGNITQEDISTLKKKCKTVKKKIEKIDSLLSDYRIAVTNQILGPIFGRELSKKKSS